MATSEADELRLTVTLVDNASAGLKQLRGEMQQIGGGQTTENMNRFRRTVDETHRGIKPFFETVEKVGKGVLPEFARGMVGGTTAMLGFGLGALGVGAAAIKMVESIGSARRELGEYVEDMIRLNAASKLSGVGPAQSKSIEDAYRRVGQSAQDAQSDILGMSRAIVDLNRPNSQIRNELLAQRMTPQQRADMERALKIMKESENSAAGLNNLREYYNQLASEGTKKELEQQKARGEPQNLAEAQQKGAAAANAFEAAFNVRYAHLLQGALATTTASQEAAWAKQTAKAQEFKAVTEDIAIKWEEIKKSWWDSSLEGSALMKSMHFIDDVMKRWASSKEREEAKAKEREEHPLPARPFTHPGSTRSTGGRPRVVGHSESGTGPGIVEGAEELGEEAATTAKGWWGRFQSYQQRIKQQRQEGPIVPRRPGSPAPQGLLGEWGADLPMSTNIEDRRGEAPLAPAGGDLAKATQDLTIEMKRLNDYLQLPVPGAAPLGLLGAPGGVSMRGLGGLPGVRNPMGALPGMPGGGGDDGAGADGGGGPNFHAKTHPFGFPLGVGRSAMPGAPGGGADGGGGGDLSRAAYDKMFAGTPLAGQFDNVVKAAQDNNVPPSTMAAIMAHETAKGTSNMLRQRNNPAGLMDPATNMMKGKSFSSIEEGVTAAGKTIGRNYARGGGSIGGMAHIYAPVGAANDPGGQNSSWAGGVDKYQRQLSAGVASGPAGAGGDPTVPSDILTRARQVALMGGPGAVERFMAQQGYPKHGNWCGEFAASVVKSVGGKPPQNPEIASNWRNYGVADASPHAGDIAVRRGAATGALGSHVTMVEDYDPKTGSFTGIGGNQRAGAESKFSAAAYDFRRADVDRAMTEHRVTGTGQLDVNVNAPKGTVVGAKGGGLFKRVQVSRQTQMEPAASSLGLGEE